MKFKFIIKLEGGLGNQMFEYAHARSLQKKYGGYILLDTHAFDKRQIRSLSLQHLSLPNDIRFRLSKTDNIALYILALLRRIISLVYSIKEYDNRFLTKIGIYSAFKTSNIKPLLPYNWVVSGWMSPRFFENVKDEIIHEFLVKETLPEKCKGMLTEIRESKSVGMHIRLGDYLSPEWKDKLYICTPDYYYKAMDLIAEKVNNPKFFVFSNSPKDIDTIKKTYHFKYKVIYVNLENSDYEDLRLMYNCKHFIISNSTYSWWAQYLGSYSNKVVVAPSRFNNYPKWDMSGIYLDSWNLVTV